MSSTYHTPIVNGDSRKNDAAIWNDPLGELDAQIVVNSNEIIAARGNYQDLDTRIDTLVAADAVLDDRIDDLIIDAGTSDAETIAARTAINYKAGSAPATLGDALEYAAGGIYNVLAYGAAAGNTAAQNTTAIQAAIDAAELTRGIVVFPSDGATYQVNKLTIEGEIVIEGNGAQLVGNTDCIFNITAAVSSLTVRGFRASWTGLTGGAQHAKQFLTNGTNNIDTAGTYSSTFVDCGKLLIEDCDLGYLKIGIYDDGATWATVRNCKWANTVADPLPNPFCLLISGEKGAVVQGCHFDVYLQNSSNIDVVKFYGSTSKSIVFDSNYVKNSNGSAYAQLDMYDGLNRAVVTNNTFINVGVIRKQVGSGPTVLDLSFDKFTNNHFERESGKTYPADFIDFNGSLAIIQGNTFVGENTAGASCIAWNQKESTNYTVPLTTQWPVGLIITNNMSYNVDYFVLSNATAAEVGRSVISNNLVWNASYIVRGSGANIPKQLAVMGNYWYPDADPSGQPYYLAGTGSFSLGNVVDQTLGAFTESASINELSVTRVSGVHRTGTTGSISDDAAYSFTPTYDRGIITIWSGSSEFEAGIYAYRSTASSNHCGLMAGNASYLGATTGVLAGTTGTDTKITVSTHTDGKIYIENRRGGARTVYYDIQA